MSTSLIKKKRDLRALNQSSQKKDTSKCKPTSKRYSHSHRAEIVTEHCRSLTQISALTLWRSNMEFLLALKKEMEEIQGNWDGDLPGYAEDQAHIAAEIEEKVDELIGLIKVLNGTD